MQPCNDFASFMYITFLPFFYSSEFIVGFVYVAEDPHGFSGYSDQNIVVQCGFEVRSYYVSAVATSCPS